MKRNNLMAIGLGLALAGYAATAVAGPGCCGKDSSEKQPVAKPAEAPITPAPAAKVNYITLAQFRELQAKHPDLLVVDVLSAASFAKNHIPGAINVPLGRLERELDGYFAKLAKDRPIVVYCASAKCHASTKAAELLMARGFTKVMDYQDGLAGWQEAKLPIGTAENCKCGMAKEQPGCCVKPNPPKAESRPACDSCDSGK